VKSDISTRRSTVLIGGAIILIAGVASAGCSSNGSQSPNPATTPTTPTTVSSSPTPSPTEKSISPTGGNLFSPPVKATPAPNVQGGQHPGINGVP
jgi:hypothetical protein